MKITIEAMKQAVLVCVDMKRFGDSGAFVRAESAERLLREAIAAEEVQSVEAVCWWNGFRKTDIREGTSPSYSEAENTWHDIPLFTHPAPPASGERSALIRQLRASRDVPSRLAANMLEADERDIVGLHRSLESLRDDEGFRAAQQVAVPQGWKLVPVEPTQEMIIDLMCTGLRHAEYRKGCSPTIANLAEGYAAMLAAAPQINAQTTGDAHEIWAAAQLAPGEGIEDGVARVAARIESPRVPMTRNQAIDTAKFVCRIELSNDDIEEDAQIESIVALVSATEAHHGIKS